jgi:hypothetical protein
MNEFEDYFSTRASPKSVRDRTEALLSGMGLGTNVPPETYRGQMLPFSVSKSRGIEWDPYNSGAAAPALTVTRKAVDAATGSGPPLKSEDIAGPSMYAIPVAGSVRGFTARVTRPPSDQALLRRSNDTIRNLSELDHPRYPTGYPDEGGVLGHYADAAVENFPPGTTRETSPEVHAALDRLRNQPGGAPKPDPVADAKDAAFQARMETDPFLARVAAQMQQLSAAAGERASGPPMTLGELVKLRENLPHNEAGAAETRTAIDNAITAGRNDFGVGDAYRNAMLNHDAAQASITAAGTPAPGRVKSALLGAADRLEQGSGPLAPSITAALLAAGSHALGMPGWITALAGTGGMATGNRVPFFGQALGAGARTLAGKPVPQGEFGPGALAARANSPLGQETIGSTIPYSPPGGGFFSPRAQLAQALMLRDAEAQRQYWRNGPPSVALAPPAPAQVRGNAPAPARPPIDYNDPENAL